MLRDVGAAVAVAAFVADRVVLHVRVRQLRRLLERIAAALERTKRE